MTPNTTKPTFQPVLIAIAVATVGIVSLLVVNHGPWNKPQIQTLEAVVYNSTASAAQAAGATVTPTAHDMALDPVAPGPKPAQPAIPAATKS